MSEIIFDIRNLVKRFGALNAVDNVSTTVKKGEVVLSWDPPAPAKVHCCVV